MNTSAEYDKIAAFINANPAGVLGTVGADDKPHGAVVYVCADDKKPVVYFLTKDETQKFRNLHKRPHVSLTIVNEPQNSTLQAMGQTAVVHDSAPLYEITKKMYSVGPHSSAWVPPLSQIQAGKYRLIAITLEHARLAEFGTDAIGEEPEVTELNLS